MRVRKRLINYEPLPHPPVTGMGLVEDENEAWIDVLAPKVEGKRIGIDPSTIDKQTLTKAGHPSRSATQCIKLYLKSIQKTWWPLRDQGLKRVRELCRECVSDELLEIRNCACINCPLWSLRIGTNPHSKGARTK